MVAKAEDQVIDQGQLYTLDAVKARLDLSDSAWRELRDAGLPTIDKGKRKYLLGSEVIKWFGKSRR